MREIKFRGKRVYNGDWVYGDLWRSYSNNKSSVCVIRDGRGNMQDIEVVPETVGQFTGLKDKNGVEIYEGDILAYSSTHEKHKGKVFNNVVEFAIGQSLCGWRMRNKSTIVKATPYKFGSSTIIGNIYQNPELITPSKTKP